MKGRARRAAIIIALLVTVGILCIPVVPASNIPGQMTDENYPQLNYSLHVFANSKMIQSANPKLIHPY